MDETWPTDGVPSSMYSRHKAAAERLLDRLRRSARRTGGDPGPSRHRGPAQRRERAAALRRPGPGARVPAATTCPCCRWTAAWSSRWCTPTTWPTRSCGCSAPALPARFNLAAAPAITADDIAAVLGARLVPVPASVVRAAVSLSWHARLQQLDAGWIDLAHAVPLLDTSRAAAELGWKPVHNAVAVLAETIEGMRAGAATDPGAATAHGGRRAGPLRAPRSREQPAAALTGDPVADPVAGPAHRLR